MYIVFEGIVGSGKTTQAKKLTEFLKSKFVDTEVLFTYEPGGDAIADAIRKLVQATDFGIEMTPECTTYLYAASRAQTLHAVVKPCLTRGGIVVADRSFISSLAQQGNDASLGIKKVLQINKHAVSNIMPDKVLFLDLPADIATKRLKDQAGDRWEKKDVSFFVNLRKTYTRIARLAVFKNRWVVIDASGTEQEVFERILNALGMHS